MTELKPCPFCPDGGRPELTKGVFGKYYARCAECGTYRVPTLPGSAEDAIEVWNTRAERTCKDVGKPDWAGFTVFECSECGEYFPEGEILKATGYCAAWDYCPNCGAKVVGD